MSLICPFVHFWVFLKYEVQRMFKIIEKSIMLSIFSVTRCRPWTSYFRFRLRQKLDKWRWRMTLTKDRRRLDEKPDMDESLGTDANCLYHSNMHACTHTQTHKHTHILSHSRNCLFFFWSNFLYFELGHFASLVKWIRFSLSLSLSL